MLLSKRGVISATNCTSYCIDDRLEFPTTNGDAIAMKCQIGAAKRRNDRLTIRRIGQNKCNRHLAVPIAEGAKA